MDREISRRVAFILAWAVLGSLILAPAAFAAETRYEDNDPAISYSSGWLQYNNARYTTGRCMYAPTAGPVAEFDFVGTKVAWYSVMAPDQGLAEVWVDSDAPVVVDRWASSYSLPIDPLRHLIVWSKDGLSYGPHTLYIRALGQRSPSAAPGGATYVTIDALDVDETQPVVSTPASSGWSLALLAMLGVVAVPLVRRARTAQ